MKERLKSAANDLVKLDSCGKAEGGNTDCSNSSETSGEDRDYFCYVHFVTPVC
ncbi:hypothetical protein ALP26_200009 [Pseudomonas savastanoi pv. glycinea]|nr:hypothetical protein ALP26_200009 [Pseudomonas savastanoi pv. glycinea]